MPLFETLSATLAAVLSANIWLLFYQRRQIHRLRIEQSEILAEEEKLLRFSHDLADAFKDETRPAELHRRIVEGVVRIAEGAGGALYLADKSGTLLVPSFVTRGCPAFAALPERVEMQARHNRSIIDSHLRLRAFAGGEGAVGTVWNAGEAIFAGKAEDIPGEKFRVPQGRQPETAMIAPLCYAGSRLGVLALATRPGEKPFRDQHFQVFKSIAEQAAFALYAAGMFAEAHEKRRMQNDLDIAQDIQRILLPQEAPSVPGFGVDGFNLPARQVSGDYFDYVAVSETLTGVAIADVSGKGVPAALIMAMCRSALRTHAIGNPSAADVLHRVNRQLYPDIQEDMFISMAYLIIDHESREITLARAGHDAPLLCRGRNGDVERLNPAGMALGVDGGDVFERVTVNHQVRLDVGDTILLYTDGVPEALDPDGEEFGLERLKGLLAESRHQNPRALIEIIGGQVRDFASGAQQHDDITLIAIHAEPT